MVAVPMSLPATSTVTLPVDCVTLQAYSVDNGSEVHAMIGKHVDHRLGPAARRMSIPVAALAATTAIRRLDASLIGLPMEDMSERFDRLPTGTLS